MNNNQTKNQNKVLTSTADETQTRENKIDCLKGMIDKISKKETNVIGGLILEVIALLYPIGVIYISRDSLDIESIRTSVINHAIFGGIVLLAIIVQAIIYDKLRKKELKFLFYKTCLEKDINDFSRDSSLEKAKLIAREHNIYVTNASEIVDLFSNIDKEINDLRTAEDQLSLQKQRDYELQLRDEYTKYAEYYGRSKRIAMLEDQLQKTLSGVKDARNAAHLLYESSQQKELDWATRGGIAAGLAGGAAGLAVALDTQAKNNEIRAQNKANYEAISPLLMNQYNTANLREKSAKELREKIQEAGTKLVSDIPQEDLFNRLKITDVSYDVTATGAVIMECKVSKPDELKIFDDVPARIDGAIIAHLTKNGNVIEDAILVFSTYGVGEFSVTLNGIFLTNDLSKTDYKIEFSPYKLWAIEE